MQPKVSVIIPCYGVEKYLDRCMDTIVNQTLKDIEIILVDDVSPDKVPQMCDEWAARDSRIKVIHKTKNEGLGYARNTGLEFATGEYVAFVDSDDFVSLEMYEILFEKGIEKELDAVYCNCVEYKDVNTQKEDIDVSKETDFFGKENVDTFLLDMIGPMPNYPKSVKYRGSVWHAIYKRSIFIDKKIKFVSEREFVSEDLVFDIDFLPQCERITWIPDALYYHCYNGASLSHTINDAKYLRNKNFIRQLDERLNTVYPQSKYKIHLQRFCIFLYLVMIRWASNGRFGSINTNDILEDDYWWTFLKDYPLSKMSLKYYLVLCTTKYAFLRPFVFFLEYGFTAKREH